MGDPTKAKEKFGWKCKVDFLVCLHMLSRHHIYVHFIFIQILFQALVKDMVESDLELMKKNPSA